METPEEGGGECVLPQHGRSWGASGQAGYPRTETAVLSWGDRDIEGRRWGLPNAEVEQEWCDGEMQSLFLPWKAMVHAERPGTKPSCLLGTYRKLNMQASPL